MQRCRRWSWIFLGGFVLGGLLGLGLLLAPPVQGWLLRRIVARQPGWRVDFAQIGVGPTGLDADGLAFAMPGVEARLAPFAIRVAPTRLFSRRELSIGQVEARKIQLILTPAKFASAPTSGPAAPPFDGVLHLLQSPLSWTLDAAHLDGDIVVRDGNESRLKGTFALRGGGLSPDSPGVFTYELSADSMILPPGPDHKFTSTGTIRVVQTFAHGIARIALEGDLRLPHYGALSLPPGRVALEVTETPTGERYVGQLALGSAVSVDLDAALTAATSVLEGRVALHVTQDAAASLLGARVPSAKVDGAVTFALNLATGDLKASITGDFDGRDWQKLMPQLAAIDVLRGHLAAALSRQGDRCTLETLDASLRGETSAAEARLSLAQPVDLRKISFQSLGELSFAHWPLTWINPFLAGAGAQLGPGEFSAAWSVAMDHGVVMFLPRGAATLGPLAVRGEKLPPSPPWQVTFSPHLAVSATKASLTLDEVVAVSASADRVEGQLRLSRDAGSGEIETTGKFHAALPGWVGASGPAQPFLADVTWDATVTGSRTHWTAFGLAAGYGDALPCLVLTSLQPFDLDWANGRIVPAAVLGKTAPASDLVRLRFSDLPLAGLSRWLPGRLFAGTLAAGESLIQALPDDGVALRTTVAWRFEDVALAMAPGSSPTRFKARFSPSITRGSDHSLAARFDDIVVTTPAWSAQGAVALGWAAGAVSAETLLEAELPALPHSAESFGPLQASLRAKVRSVAPDILGAEEFDLRVKNSSGELLSLVAPQPFIFGLSNSGSMVMSTLAPLRLKLGAFPLAWLRPWSGPLQLEGAVPPVELALSAKTNAYTLRALAPVRVEHLGVRRSGRDWAREATATFTPGLDLTLIAVTRPKFQMAYTGQAHVAGATIDFGGRSGLGFDLGVGFKGDDRRFLPDQVDFTGHLDFAALPNSAALGLPARGTLEARVNGDLLNTSPIVFSAHLAGVPGPDGRTSLPPLDVTLHGRLRDQVVGGAVKLVLAATPQPTDLAFNLKFDLADGGFNVTSGLHGQFVDVGALLALARAFPPGARATVTPKKARPVAAELAAAPVDVAGESPPFWGDLRGAFSLDLGAVQFAPYRIDHVRGQIVVDARAFELRELGGEMFAGRWGGGLRVEHDPANRTGEHTLAGEFHIVQFESARVVQAVFPQQLASIDARINVDAHVASHGASFVALLDHSTADFAVDGANGVMRLTVPKSDLLSTAAVFGGTVLLSPELRALGRLMKKFAEMPVERLRIAGRRDASGEVSVDEFRFESPQARLTGGGRIAADPGQPLLNHPLELSLKLAAKDELAVILGGMGLLEKKAAPDGFRSMRRPFSLGGRAGAPDTAPLYDLLATGVSGSHGTWGFLMRKVETEVEKKQPGTPSH